VILRSGGNELYQRVAVVGPNTTTYADTTARPGTSYTHIILAVNAVGALGWSIEASVTTL
jgi:hypothetical protein